MSGAIIADSVCLGRRKVRLYSPNVKTIAINYFAGSNSTQTSKYDKHDKLKYSIVAVL